MLRDSKSQKLGNTLIIQQFQTQKPKVQPLATKDEALQFIIKYYLYAKSFQNPKIKLIKAQLSQILQYYSSFYILDYHEQFISERKIHLFNMFKKSLENQKYKKNDKQSLLNDLVSYMYKISCKNNACSEIKSIEQSISKLDQQQKAVENNNHQNINKENTQDNITNIIQNNNQIDKEIEFIDIQKINEQNLYSHENNTCNPQVRMDKNEPMEIEEPKLPEEYDLIDINAVFPQS